MSEQMINHVNNLEKANKEQNNESVTVELEGYKERVKTFEQRLNIDLRSREKMIDSQMDDMIKEKLALKEQVDSLEQNLSKQIKEKECLLQTFTIFRKQSKEKEDKYMENEIDLEKKIKELDNILFKVGQSAQTKAQRIKPTLYDGIFISDKHVAMIVIDDEETLILEEKSRSKISEKEKDLKAIKQNISHTPIDYEKLNKLSDDFGKHFTPQHELSVEHAFWLRMSNPTSKPFDASLVKIEAPKELSKSSVDKKCLEIGKKELLLENDRLLQQIMSQDVLLTVMNSMSLIGESVNMDRNRNELCDKCFNLEAELLKSQNAHNDLLKNESCNNQNALEIPEFFENNDLKAHLQDKDTTICKLKDIIKSMREKSKKENVNSDYGEIETKNVELENSVAKLLLNNDRLCKEINHVKQVFKEQFDSIKKMRVHTKEHSDYLIDKLNLKSAENEDLKAQIQDKVFVITSLKNDLQKLKGKEIVNIAAQTPFAYTIVPHMFKLDLKGKEIKKMRVHTKEHRKEIVNIAAQTPFAYTIVPHMFKLDLEPLAPRLLQNREAHTNYLKYTQEQDDILQEIELLVYVRDTCPNAIKLSAKRLLSHPKTMSRKLGLECSTSNCGSKPTGNKRNDKISRTPSRNMKNKHSLLNANSEPICATCKKSMFDGVHDMCLLDFVKNVNGRSSKKAKILESKNANHSEPNHTWGSNATDIPSSSSLVMTVRFENDNIARIMGYGDYRLGNVTISRVYYVEGLGHNLFSVGQFCDVDLEVAFPKNTCFTHNLEGVDLLSESRDTNLNTISLDDMLKTSPISLISKASKTKSRLWHRRLSHLNFGTPNKLAKDSLARGILRLKFQKDHMCSACALGKSKKSCHQPKSKDTNQEKLYLLHMNLCGLMRMASINGKRYIIVIVDDYSRFTWVRFLRTKDKAPEAIIKCIKNIQVCLNAIVRKQNGVVERRNRTLVEAACTMLIFFKAPLLLWAGAINTACYTQNRSLIHRRYNKTPYELMQDKKPDLSIFHVFGALCYPTNDNDDLGKLDAKADI
ncbi:retrovirus-related pol polyprotein from transposon TNT 1-94, partial [Tanacetum coccineum]